MRHDPMLLMVLCFMGAVIWLVVTLRDITRHRVDLERADKQLTMYLALHSKTQDRWEKAQTQEQVDISRAIYCNVAHKYNLCLLKPQNIIVARIMGYRTIIEDEK